MIPECISSTLWVEARQFQMPQINEIHIFSEHPHWKTATLWIHPGQKHSHCKHKDLIVRLWEDFISSCEVWMISIQIKPDPSVLTSPKRNSRSSYTNLQTLQESESNRYWVLNLRFRHLERSHGFLPQWISKQRVKFLRKWFQHSLLVG